MPIRRLNFQPFSDPSGRSADECVAPGRRQPRETRWTSDRRLSSPETNWKVALLPLFFMQLLLLHMFLSFMVRTSPLWGGSNVLRSAAWEKAKMASVFLETATRSDSLAARDRDVEEHWNRRRNQKLWKVWALEVLTGRRWLPSLEGRFSVDISLCRYAMASTWKAETAS